MNLLAQFKLCFLLFVITSCDKTSRKYYAINEDDPLRHSWSMLVSIRYGCQQESNSNTHCCTGTILTKSYVLTSADCVESLPSDMTIVAGVHTQFDSELVVRKVDQIIIHPDWTNDYGKVMHNIALLHLSNSLTFSANKHITPIRSAVHFDPLKNTRLIVIDWMSSRKNLNATISYRSQPTEVSLVNNNDPVCHRWVTDVKQQFCARLHYDNQGSCDHKSGQPMLQWMNNRWIQVGVISSAAVRAGDSCIGVFTGLAYYYEWIESVVSVERPTSLNNARMADSMANSDRTYKCNVYTTSCGCSAENVELSSMRIIGGKEAIPHSWTMVVSIHLNDSEEVSCAGSILTKSFILTSAHCVDGASLMDMYIIAGVHDRIADFAMIRYVHNAYIHPGWNRTDGTYRNDIAVLYIFPPLPISGNGNLALSCVPYIHSLNEIVNYPSYGSHLVMVGWGSTEYGSNIMSDTLHQASVYVIDNNNSNCSQSIHDVEKQFCAGMDGRDPCHGDMGGPIFQWKGNHWEQVGITSHGGRCNRIGSSSIFTRLVHYFDWMESVINSSLTTTTLAPPPTPTTYVCNKISPCGCGKTDVALTPSRIVGGEDALDDSWPMIVSLRLNGTTDHSCGGTILSESYILTAAHCFRRIPTEHPMGVTIAAGMTNRSDLLQIIRNVDRIYIHPYYISTSNDYHHDIALLHIDQPFVFESNSRLTKTCIHHVGPPLVINQYPRNGTSLAVIGWGILRFGTGYIPEILQQAQIFAIDNQDPICLNTVYNTDLQFCAGLYEGGKDSCQGDSGGPVFQWTGQYWEQVGIVSYGEGCASADFPGVNTRLSYYYDWIEEILKRDGEQIEPDIQSYVTIVDPSITSEFDPQTSTVTSYRSSSVVPNSAHRYKFDLVIFGSFLLSFWLYSINKIFV